MIVDLLINMILAIGLISLFNLTRYILKIRKLVKKYKDNPNVEGITIVNGQVKIIEKSKPENNKGTTDQEHQLVRDHFCNKEIEKSQAYRIVKKGKEYFFCSWECREQFLRQEEGI